MSTYNIHIVVFATELDLVNKHRTFSREHPFEGMNESPQFLKILITIKLLNQVWKRIKIHLLNKDF